MDLAQAVELYLETRRRFGFALVQVGIELRSLVRYAQQIRHRGPLTASLATGWAQQPQRCAPGYRAHRLAIVRRFARFWLAFEPRTELPPQDGFGPRYPRRAVHIYSPQALGTLLRAAAQLGRVHPLRGWSFCTLVGLLACTGLRIGEALKLADQDIDWSSGVLAIRHGKNGHARLVPVQPSTLEALARYRTLRQQAMGAAAGGRAFSLRFAERPWGITA